MRKVLNSENDIKKEKQNKKFFTICLWEEICIHYIHTTFKKKSYKNKVIKLTATKAVIIFSSAKPLKPEDLRHRTAR